MKSYDDTLRYTKKSGIPGDTLSFLKNHFYNMYFFWGETEIFLIYFEKGCFLKKTKLIGLMMPMENFHTG